MQENLPVIIYLQHCILATIHAGQPGGLFPGSQRHFKHSPEEAECRLGLQGAPSRLDVSIFDIDGE